MRIFVFLLFIFSLGTSSSANSGVENRNCRVIKGAPLQSLFAQFCLHALWFGNCNIRGWFLHKESFLQSCFSYMILYSSIFKYVTAIAVLWIDFVREIRWYWEESELLPRVSGNGTIDLSCCIVHQKLQMVLHIASLIAFSIFF
jgi:Rab3 GTPase-activating protein catalytic subunit